MNKTQYNDKKIVEMFAAHKTGQNPQASLVPKSSHWAIVLAGGSGQRMRPALRQWFGHEKPKQFCTFVGERNMLEHTWDRARNIVGSQNVLTVSVSDHKPYFAGYGDTDIPGEILYQPANQGTAAAIFLALALILSRDPHATVIVMPSDHFIFPETRFNGLAQKALMQVDSNPARAILFGAEASWPNGDYGWMETGAFAKNRENSYPFSHELLDVSSFHEKPDQGLANQLWQRSALWSTMIVAAKAASLWQWGLEQLNPMFFRKMEYVLENSRNFEGKKENDNLNKAISLAFRHLPELDFSHAMITACPGKFLALPMSDIEWDDWGRPERILDTIQRHNFIPRFIDPENFSKRNANGQHPIKNATPVAIPLSATVTSERGIAESSYRMERNHCELHPL